MRPPAASFASMELPLVFEDQRIENFEDSESEGSQSESASASEAPRGRASQKKRKAADSSRGAKSEKKKKPKVKKAASSRQTRSATLSYKDWNAVPAPVSALQCIRDEPVPIATSQFPCLPS